MDARAKRVIEREGALRSERANFEVQWQEIAELILPMRADFNIKRSPGEKRGLQSFDGTGGLANQNLASGLWGMITNSANTWFMLEHPDETLDQDFEVRSWNDAVAETMRNEFASGGQAFYSRALDLYADLSAFGTGIMFADQGRGGRLRFSTRRLTECVIAENEEERIDTLFRKFQMTYRQAVQRWGDRAPKRAREGLEKSPDEKIEIIHATYPNGDLRRERMDARGMAFTSLHVSCEGEVIQEGGYEEFPYMVPRWSTATGSLYGESPAMLALVDIKTLNSMSKTFMVAAQKAADPPLLVADENAMGPVRATPGGIIYGAIAANGQAMVQALDHRGNFQLTEVMLEQRRQAIRDAFFASLLVMVQTPNATATEVLARQEEQLRLMGPHLGRVQSEFLDPLIGRVFNLLWRANRLPPLPPALASAPLVQTAYVSPLARAQKVSEAQSIVRAFDAVLPIAQQRPEVLDNFDLDAFSRAVVEGMGAPAKLLRDKRAIEQERAQRAQQLAQERQRQQMLEAAQVAPGVATAAKTAGLIGAPA